MAESGERRKESCGGRFPDQLLAMSRGGLSRRLLAPFYFRVLFVASGAPFGDYVLEAHIDRRRAEREALGL